MAESKAEKKEEPEKLATDAQIRLANQLEQETGYPEAVPDEVLALQTRREVSDYLHKLKEYKVRDQALRAVNNKVPGFDKIVHAMLFKLAWNDDERKYFAHRAKDISFEGAMTELYDTFKGSEAACRKHVKESGQK